MYFKTLSKVKSNILEHSQNFTDSICHMDSWTNWTGYYYVLKKDMYIFGKFAFNLLFFVLGENLSWRCDLSTNRQ